MEHKTETPKGKINKVEQCKTCGSNLMRMNKARHSKFKKHVDALYVRHDMYLVGDVKEEDSQTCNGECNTIDTV